MKLSAHPSAVRLRKIPGPGRGDEVLLEGAEG